MSNAVSQSNAHDHRISALEVRIDQRVGRQIFVNMADGVGCKPRRAIPIEPATFGVTADSAEKPVQLLRIDIYTVKFKNHRRRGDRATFPPDRAVLGHAAKRIIIPFFITLAKRRHRELNTMEKVTAATR